MRLADCRSRCVSAGGPGRREWHRQPEAPRWMWPLRPDRHVGAGQDGGGMGCMRRMGKRDGDPEGPKNRPEGAQQQEARPAGAGPKAAGWIGDEVEASMAKEAGDSTGQKRGPEAGQQQGGGR